MPFKEAEFPLSECIVPMYYYQIFTSLNAMTSILSTFIFVKHKHITGKQFIRNHIFY